MKKSKIFMLCGICLLGLALVMDVVLSCMVLLPGTIVFDFGMFARLIGDIVTVVIGILLIRQSKKLEQQGE